MNEKLFDCLLTIVGIILVSLVVFNIVIFLSFVICLIIASDIAVFIASFGIVCCILNFVILIVFDILMIIKKVVLV